MSVDALWKHSQLRGLDYGTAKLYGMPHVGCRYAREDVNATAWDGDYRRCAACGRTGGPHSKHHEPPKSRGRQLLLDTPMGRFVLMPALIDLCGSGTTGCHGDRHSGRLRISWEWDEDKHERMWWDGTFLSRGLAPHGEWMYRYGRYIIETRDAAGEWHASEYRGEQ